MIKKTQSRLLVTPSC